MNEQMQKLFQEAVAYAGSIAGNDEDSNYAEWFNIYKAKFAELIIRECAMFIVLELEGKVGSRIADATANRLEEHFGIKE